MVGRMGAASREKISTRISLLKYGGAADVASKLDQLRRLRDELLAADFVLLAEFLSPVLDLLSDSLSPVRKFITQMIGEIGLKHLELLPEIIPALLDVLKDDTPAVARQAIMCGIDIFRCTLVKVAIQGLYSSEFSESLKSAWACMLKFRDEIYSMAFKVGSDGRRLPALKFVESVVLLYTPDPNASLGPPPDQISEGKFDEFNVSWLRGGHPILNIRELSAEASQNLGLLLDQLRFPSLKSNSYLTIIVLIKSLSAVAQKRPAFYGRILPVLLGLDPSNSASKGIQLAGVHHALKNAFESCLNCTHPGAAPWRDRLISALKEIKVGKPTEQAANEISGNDERSEWTGDSHVAQTHEDEKPSLAFVSEHSNAAKKRTAVPDEPDFIENDMSGKRAKSTPDNLEGPGNEMGRGRDRVPSSGQTPSTSDADNGPVQQLVAMFGALVAQGEKASASLEILISSISADLLAEVVMANIRNLPPKIPKSEGDEEPVVNMVAPPEISRSDTHIRHLSLLLTNILSQPRPSLENEVGAEDPDHSVSSEPEQTQEEEKPVLPLGDSKASYDDLNYGSQQETVSLSESVSPEDIPSAMVTGHTSITSEVDDIEGVVNEIPGLALSTQDDGLPENVAVSPKDLTDLDDANKEKLTSSERTSVELDGAQIELVQSFSTDRSEELSPKAAITDTTSLNNSTATSVGFFSQLVLPKISAPIIHIAAKQKEHLQQLAFVRIIDAYKQVTIAGGSQVRFSILAHSVMEFPSEQDPWKLLKAHILSDYVNHEGHELTLRILYRLFGEAEEDRDLVTTATATSAYETFLLQVAETLRDSFPASDKSLSKLLVEVPYLPKSIFEMLECLCSPGSNDNDYKELHGGDRVTQGLSAVWSLILLRPPIRDACLKIALKSAAHHLEEVRMKAIRLVANKLYPLPSISGKIEDFAKEMLLSLVSDDQIASTKEADGTHAELHKEENPSIDIQSVSSANKEISPDSHQFSASESFPSSMVAEAQRCMSLYFALCTKKHYLFRQIFDVYFFASRVAKQAVQRQIPLLVRTIGSSRDLLDIISNPPTGSEGLVIQVVHTLTDGTVPSPELVSTIKMLYDTKLKDVDILIPILPFLPKDEILLLFPHLVNAPVDKFQVALSRVIQGLNNSAPVLTPAEALIAIHGIDPEREKIPLKKVTDACNACFEQRHIFSQQVLAKVLNQLVEQIPLPMLFMRTVLQAIGAFPSLVEFIMEILSRLVSKQVWKYPKLWVGFMKCALLTKPQSFGVLLQLPTAQLENALNRTPALRAPLVAHASQPHIRSSLPRSTLVVLGLVSESQTSNQTQPTQTQTAETESSEKDTVTDKSKESSAAS
ncbi:mRNA cleavage and polyadenylation factor II complex, subunit PTA1 [Handroanthus impetiginosus]|uniref:mRNA cleavage and polyadenylation factor II complex, subunit PTA1 n=1 Tax=Handroanthus impetiginosus TaxID=429701 RepID=A0A2G9GW17_9LAMI|nr:mRNA cleavage and polyadenylation factor II complex, subunit PTA1 [Handroanthus impetiginosus]